MSFLSLTLAKHSLTWTFRTSVKLTSTPQSADTPPSLPSSTLSSTEISMAGKFEPKVPVQLDPPKDDPISLEELAKANGMHHSVFQG